MVQCLLFSTFVALVAAARVVLTGSVVNDFNASSTGVTSTGYVYNDVEVVLDGSSSLEPSEIDQVVPDVTIPSAFPNGTVSGWDVRSIRVQYDYALDKLFIGIDCFGICGDADGDGDASRTGLVLAGLGGVDKANLAGGESFAMALSFDLNVANVLPVFDPNVDVPWNVMLGVPAVDSDSLATRLNLPCLAGKSAGDADFADLSSCFGLYEYLDVTDIPLASRFKAPLLFNGQPWPVSFYATPTNGLEWTVSNVTALRRLYMETLDPSLPWSVLAQLYAGSTVDATIGDEFAPNLYDYYNLPFPCYSCCPFDANGPAGGVYLTKDACGVCGGDGSSCATSSSTGNAVATVTTNTTPVQAPVAAASSAGSNVVATATATPTDTNKISNPPLQATPTAPAMFGCPVCREDVQCEPGYTLIEGILDATGCTTCDRCQLSVSDESGGATLRVTLASLLFLGASMLM